MSASEQLQLVKFAWGDFDTYNFAQEEKLQEAFRMGFFRIAIPVQHRILIEKTMQFAEKIRCRAEEGRFNLGTPFPFGYNVNPKQRSARVSLEKENWDVYPEETRKLGEELQVVSIKILKTVLTFFKIPAKKWDEVTAQVTAKQGSLILAMTNYEPEPQPNVSEPVLGAKPHKDTGFLTVLYNDKPGLEAIVKKDSKKNWKSVSVDVNSYIINFGTVAQKFFNSKKLRAVKHRVTEIVEKRQSFVVIIQPKTEDWVYQRTEEGEFVRLKRCDDVIKDFFVKYGNI